MYNFSVAEIDKSSDILVLWRNLIHTADHLVGNRRKSPSEIVGKSITMVQKHTKRVAPRDAWRLRVNTLLLESFDVVLVS